MTAVARRREACHHGYLALDGVDIASFRVMGDGYSRDDRSLWFGHEPIATRLPGFIPPPIPDLHAAVTPRLPA